MLLKDELQSIISGTGEATKGTAIQTIANYVRKSKTASTNSEKKEFIKEQEAAAILDYAQSHNFFFTGLNKERYLAEGAEQKVYLDEDGRYVTKLNDSIFYATWEDYFHSLLLHNYFFPTTNYELIGFYYEAEKLYAAVKQPYINVTEPTRDDAIKELMALNGFTNKKNSDYFSKELGIILEDLHDENVLTSNGVLFFIDTVFYLTDDFFKK
jgi:Serine/Threonine/Tyrosine Kinase found in polyvalent proteins